MASGDFSSLDDAALVSQLVDAEHELVRQRFRLSLNRLENTSGISVTRKGIARMRTELRRREIDGGMPKGSLLAKHRGAATPSKSGDEAASGGLLDNVVDKLD